MHAILFDAGPIIVSAVIAAAICLHVARGIHKAGVERYGGRILIFSAVINTGIVVLMLLLLGAMGLRGVLTPGGFHVLGLAVALFLLILPIRAIWIYASAPGRIMRQSGVTPLGAKEDRMEISAVVEVMGIQAPRILSSPLHRTPFVFGLSSRTACIVIPDTWSSVEANNRHVMLCHELAHIRNSDVGFMTWSFAFLHDLKWLLLLSPVVMLASLFSRQEYLPRAAVLYVACLLILWLLTNTVVRSRELLADSTVAMLIDSGKIARTFDEMLLAPSTGLRHSDTDSPDTILRIRSWLMDKAMFSMKARFWKAVARLTELAVPTHPPVSARLAAIHNRHSASADASRVRGTEAFWVGLTLGFLGVLIALGGFWTGKFLLGWEDDEQIVLLSYDCWGSIGPLLAAFIALFFALPAWSSLHPHVPAGRNLAHLLARSLYGLLGACCVQPFILLGGWSHIEIKVLLVLSIFWVLVTLVMGIVVEIVMLSLWLILRYKQRNFYADLSSILYSFGIGLLAILGYFTYGLVLLLGTRVFTGGCIIMGFLAGLFVFLLVTRDSRGCRTEQYMVLSLLSAGIRLEGSTYKRWSPLVGSLHMIVLCLVPAGVTSAIIHVLWYRSFGHIGNLVAAAIVLLLGCGIFVILDWQWPKRLHETGRQKICALLESQAFLRSEIPMESSRSIDRILRGIQIQVNISGRLATMTTDSMADLSFLASQRVGSGLRILEQARQWATECEARGGFGIWPRSGPRLSSTYQCLQILQETGGIQLADPNHHVLWILGLRTSDGSFRGPWSYRPKWEDTFFAVASLAILCSNLDGEARAKCLDYVRQTLVSEGIEKGQLDAVRYCLATAEILGGLDEEMANSAGQWLSLELDKLLLTNVAHNAENIHHAVYAYHILKERGISLFHPEQIGLLADRIAAALEAELASLRI